MMMVAMSVLGVFFVASWTAMTAPAAAAATEASRADVYAAEMLNYRASVVRYLKANPSAPSGTISNSSLATYRLTGAPSAPEGRYGNYWNASSVPPALYVYSNQPLPQRVTKAVAHRMGDSKLVGVATQSGQIATPSSGYVEVNLPGREFPGGQGVGQVGEGIQSGALVIVGK